MAFRKWLALSMVGTLFAGCSASHTLTHDPDAFRPDAGEMDAGPPDDAGAMSCSLTPAPTELRIEAEQLGFHDCGDMRGQVTEVELTVDTLRVGLDGCPLADDDCRCAYTVGPIQASVANDFFVGEQIRVRADADRLAFEMLGDCLCEACECALPRVLLYAQRSSLGDDPLWTERFRFATSQACSETPVSNCQTVRHRVLMSPRLVTRGFGGAGAPPSEPPRPPVLEAEEGQFVENPERMFLGVVKATFRQCSNQEAVLRPVPAMFYGGQFFDRLVDG